MDLPNVMVLAELEDGSVVFLTSSDHTLASANWLLDRAKGVLSSSGGGLGLVE